MSKREKFVSRWSRLKNDSKPGRGQKASEGRMSTVARRTRAEEATGALPVTDQPPPESFDLTSLPPIDTINAGTDIRAFLCRGVPAELTRAALRRAWVSDPAIRDFIGIAENQWDFNDPSAIPGFGPLREPDDMPSLVAQALGKLGKAASAAFVAMPWPREQGLLQTRAEAVIANTGTERDVADLATEPECEAGANDDGRRRRSHGGALPR